MLTKNGICYNFNVTPYHIELNEIDFSFSSELHVKKFIDKMDNEIDIMNYGIFKKYGVKCDFKILALLKLYVQIEKRGFLIKYKGVLYKCKEDLLQHLNAVII